MYVPLCALLGTRTNDKYYADEMYGCVQDNENCTCHMLIHRKHRPVQTSWVVLRLAHLLEHWVTAATQVRSQVSTYGMTMTVSWDMVFILRHLTDVGFMGFIHTFLASMEHTDVAPAQAVYTTWAIMQVQSVCMHTRIHCGKENNVNVWMVQWTQKEVREREIVSMCVRACVHVCVCVLARYDPAFLHNAQEHSYYVHEF